MKLREVKLEDLKRIRDGSGHSIYGPSGSGMYLNCPGSLIPNLLAPDHSGPEAAYGTVAHEVTEIWLLTGRRPTELVGQNRFIESGEWGFVIWIDDEMLDYAERCVDWVEWLPGEHMIEKRVDFSRITPIPNQSGTADFITIDGDTMWVVDWKFGKNHRVYAKHNTQAMLYALGALWAFDPDGKVKKIIIRIGQPRLDHFDEWECSRDELLEFAGWAKARMALAWSTSAPRIAGQKQCQFCRINADCTAYAKLLVEMTEGVFDDLTQPVTVEDMQEFKDRLDDDLEPFDPKMLEIGTLSTAQLARLKPFRKMAEAWWKKVEIELVRRALDGESLEVYGQKIVEGRANRKVRNEDKLVEQMEFLGIPRERLYSTVLVTPSEAEILVKKAGYRNKDVPDLLKGLFYKPKGKPTVVPLSDKRDAIADLTEDAFDNLESETEDGES